MKIILTVAGMLCVGLGIIGAVMPVLPTTPFLLLAAGCFARSSDRLHQRLLCNPVFGPVIENWQQHGAISRRARWTATLMIMASFAFSIVAVIPNIWGQIAMVLTGAAVIAFIHRIPVRG